MKNNNLEYEFFEYANDELEKLINKLKKDNEKKKLEIMKKQVIIENMKTQGGVQ